MQPCAFILPRSVVIMGVRISYSLPFGEIINYTCMTVRRMLVRAVPYPQRSGQGEKNLCSYPQVLNSQIGCVRILRNIRGPDPSLSHCRSNICHALKCRIYVSRMISRPSHHPETPDEASLYRVKIRLMTSLMVKCEAPGPGAGNLVQETW